MKKSIFISHASKDSRIAEELRTRLEAIGIGCWIAPRDIEAGKSYAEAIVDGIAQCSVCLLVLSENANKSDAVAKEIERAFNYQKLIVPFRVREVVPGKKIEFFVSNAQWVDAFSSPIADRIEYLAAVVQAAEANEKPPIPEPPRNGFGGRLEQLLERSLRYRMISGVAVLVLFTVIGAAGLLIQRNLSNEAQVVSEEIKQLKQGTDTDPRKELQNLGISYSYQSFRTAFREGDVRAVELFLQAGMKVTQFDQFHPFQFNADSAKLVMKYDAINSGPDNSTILSICGVPKKITYTPDAEIGSNGFFPMLDAKARVKDAQTIKSIMDFRRWACNRPTVINRVADIIKEIENHIETSSGSSKYTSLSGYTTPKSEDEKLLSRWQEFADFLSTEKTEEYWAKKWNQFQ